MYEYFFENVQLLPFDKLLEPVEGDKINHVQSNFLWEKLEEKQVYIIFAWDNQKTCI